MAANEKKFPSTQENSDVIYNLDEGRRKYRPQVEQAPEPTSGGGDDPPPTKPPASERKLAARRRNESVKLVASGLSGLGLGLVSIGFIQPLLKDAALLVKEPHWGWYAIGIGLHLFSHFIIHTELQRED